MKEKKRIVLFSTVMWSLFSFPVSLDGMSECPSILQYYNDRLHMKTTYVPVAGTFVCCSSE